ncbi:6970_t:CDS:1, partial [Entrophospora sp. SA101]
EVIPMFAKVSNPDDDVPVLTICEAILFFTKLNCLFLKPAS